MTATFQLSMYAGTSRFSEKTLRYAIQQCLHKVETTLELYPDNLEVEVYGDRHQWRDNHTLLSEEGLFTWVLGDCGRIIRVVAEEEKVRSDRSLARVVCHECVHHVIHHHTGQNIPAWLDEGLAIHFTQELPRRYLETLVEALRSDTFLPLEFLEQPFTRLDRTMKNLAYGQAVTLVVFLVTRYGYVFVRAMLDDCKRGDRWERTLRRQALTLYLLEKEWQRWLEGWLCERLLPGED